MGKLLSGLQVEPAKLLAARIALTVAWPKMTRNPVFQQSQVCGFGAGGGFFLKAWVVRLGFKALVLTTMIERRSSYLCRFLLRCLGRWQRNVSKVL
jgi:hypothetical protein